MSAHPFIIYHYVCIRVYNKNSKCHKIVSFCVGRRATEVQVSQINVSADRTRLYHVVKYKIILDRGGDGTDDANHLWVDDLATACNFLSADEDEEVETPDWSAAAADETAANDKLDSQLCTFTETQRDFRQQHWYAVCLKVIIKSIFTQYLSAAKLSYIFPQGLHISTILLT